MCERGRLRQCRTKLVHRLRRHIFGRLYKLNAGRLIPAKENLCKMTENMQAICVQSEKRGICAVLP